MQVVFLIIEAEARIDMRGKPSAKENKDEKEREMDKIYTTRITIITKTQVLVVLRGKKNPKVEGMMRVGYQQARATTKVSTKSMRIDSGDFHNID